MERSLHDSRRYPRLTSLLLALAGDELHGYGIMLEAARQSMGKSNWAGNSYEQLKKLLAAGLSRRAAAACG